MYLHHINPEGGRVFSFGCRIEPLKLVTPWEKIEEYRQWLVDHPDADSLAISEIMGRIRNLQQQQEDFINEVKKWDK